MKLDNLIKISGSSRKSKRLGRGSSSGKGGHTVGRGQKGQKARSKIKTWFEGGQKPFIHRLPYMRGFKRNPALTCVSFNLDTISHVYGDKEEVSRETLVSKGLLKASFLGRIKILGRGSLEKPLTFSSEITFSESAKKAVNLD